MKYEKNGYVLEINKETGLSNEEAKRRKELFNFDWMKYKKITTYFNRIIFLILVGVTLFTIFNKRDIMMSVIMVLFTVSSFNPFWASNQKEDKRQEIIKKRSNELIPVYRNSKDMIIKRGEVAIGDIIKVEEGGKFLVNGIIIEGEKLIIATSDSGIIQYKTAVQCNEGLINKYVNEVNSVEEGMILLEGAATIFVC